MLDTLKGKYALVTGAAQGNGKAIAIGLAKFGLNIICLDLDLEKLNQLAEEIKSYGVKVQIYEADITNIIKLKDIRDDIDQKIGHLDILINNAGVIYRGPSDTDDAIDAWRKVLNVNLDGTYYCSTIFLPLLKRCCGSIINVGSIQSFVSLSTLSAAYGASKGAIRMLTQKLANEFIEHKIRVNAIAPGFINTPINSAITDKNEINYRLSRVPMGRFGEPHEMIGPILFLASGEMSSYITGIMLPVDGGLLSK